MFTCTQLHMHVQRARHIFSQVMVFMLVLFGCTNMCSISGCVQIAIYLARYACGLTAPPASKVVLPQLVSVVVAWEVLGKLGYRCFSSWGLLCLGFSQSSAYSTVSWSRQWLASGSGSGIITFLQNEC
jgi:hypothetical protein